MKRKLFTLLFALVALASFQAKAQMPKYFWIDVDTTTNAGTTAGAYPSPGSTNYYVDQVWDYKNSMSFESGFSVKPFRANDGLGYEKSKYYFKVDTTSVGRKEFRITSYDLSSVLNLTGAGVSNQNRWQVVQISDGTGTGDVVYSETMDKSTGYAETTIAGRHIGLSACVEGYLVYPETGGIPGTNDNFKMVFVERATGKFVLDTYGKWAANTGKFKEKYNPVWVKFIPIGGRWARPADFASAEYSQFKDMSGNYLEVGGNKTFRVSYVPGHSPKEGGSVCSYAYVDADPAKNGGRAHLGMYDNPTTGCWEVPVFTLAAPGDCKLVSVAKDNVKYIIGNASNGAYADKLELRDAVTSGSFLDEEAGAQEFAIWIDEDGNMRVYPRVGYVANYNVTATDANRWLPKLNSNGTPATGTDTDWATGILAGKYSYGYYQYNVAIYRNYYNIPTNDPLANQAFKIGTFNSGTVSPVLAPVSGYVNGTMTEYSERIFSPINLANYTIATGRFFFLETRPIAKALNGDAKTNNNTTSYVLSVFGASATPAHAEYTKIHARYNNWATNNVKVVLTPKEQVRGNQDATNYPKNPFDSIRMASHWEVMDVFDASNVKVGYTFRNELGYYLQYGTPGDAVVMPQTPVTSGTDVRTSAVWTAVRMDENSEYFYLRNNYVGGPQQTAYASYFSDLAYLDTIPYSATGGFGTGLYTKGYTNWYQSSERPASVTGGQVKTWYWNRDVALLPRQGCGGGIELKLTSDENWPKDRGTVGVIDHTNDSQFPKQDSLCTYMYRNGVYNITEALELALSFDKDRNNVVYLSDNPAPSALSVEPVGAERMPVWVPSSASTPTVGYWDTKGYVGTDVMWEENWMIANGFYGGGSVSSIDNSGATSTYPVYGASVGSIKTGNPSDYVTLGTTGVPTAASPDIYKWHYIKYGTDMYLVYDTINAQTHDPKLMYGFKFKKVDKRNATPVRFHQPLVGDKYYQNYLIEFKVPDYFYEVSTATGNIIAENTPYGSGTTDSKYAAGDSRRTHQLRWYNQTNVASTVVSQAANYATPTDPLWVAGKTRFAQLGNQSAPLYTTEKATDATRFQFTGNEVIKCPQKFVTSSYLLEQGMYMQPITAEEYLRGNALNWFIADGAVEKQGKSNAEQLTYTLAETLYAATDRIGLLSTDAGSGASGTYARYYPDYADYTVSKPAVDVELFYVQNSKGEYLTVSDTTDMGQTETGTTVPDVSGAKLTFIKEKYTYSKADADAGKQDKRPLQMFAIHGCLNTNGQPYGEFIFLPAASWEMDYTTGKTDGYIKNNVNLGMTDGSGYTIVNTAFRIGLYGKDTHMVVMPASGSTSTSIVAAEYKFSRQQYYTDFCDHNFVKKVYTTSKDVYYTGQKTTANAAVMVSCADLTKPDMHWEFTPSTTDPALFSMSVELKSAQQVAFKGQYYFIAKDTADKKNVKLFAINKFNPADTATVVVSCIDNLDSNPLVCTDRYYKFSADQLISSDWGIIESYYTDRYVWTKDASIYINNQGRSRADAIGKKLETGKSAEFLVIEPSYTRYISEHHNVPYYNVVRVKDGVRYYMEMQHDTVIFRTVTQAEKDTLENYVQYPTALPGMKFCFPYRTVKDVCPMQVDSTLYKGAKFPNVFVQSLDTASVQASLLKFDATSGLLAATPIDVNTVDYSAVLGSQSGKLDASTWFFGDNYGADYEWVRLQGVLNSGNQDTKGWLTAATNNNPGSTYVVASGNALPTPNYGILDAYRKGKDGSLSFVFEGDATVGYYAGRPIWYYRIKNAANEYLTNAVDSGAIYKFGPNALPYAFFGGLVADAKYNTNDSVKHDKNYDQTFGLRHVPISMQPGQKENMYFWVVSRVNYQTPANTEYYYLSQVNDRMVFNKANLKYPEQVLTTAMMFQLGNADENGYTDITPVDGATKIYGVEGAVKVLNAEGLVEVYTIDGRLVKSVTVNSADETIAAPRGVVIVKNGANVAKVVVK